MAGESPSFMVQGDVRPSRFVNGYASADNTVEEADANDFVCGISSEGSREPNLPSVATILAGTTGDQMKVYGDGQICLLEIADTVTRFTLLKSDADGCGVPALLTGTTIQNVGAEALQSGAAGEKIKVRVFRQKLLPAVS